MIVRVLQTGWRHAVAQWRMAALLYAVNLSAALLPALAFRSSASSLGTFPAVQDLLSVFRFSTFIDVLRVYGREVTGVLPVLPWLVLLFIVINTFLAGGIVASFCGMEMEFSGKGFFSSCAEYFFRFLRLLLLWGVCVVIVSGLSLGIMAVAWSWITDNAQTETAGLTVLAVAGFVFLLIATLMVAIADYARIIVVANDERRVFRAFVGGAKFVAGNLFRTLLVLLVPLLIFVIALVIYFVKEDWLGMTSAGTVFLVFVLQQALTMVRHWLHIFAYASETTLYMDQVPMIV